MTVRSAPSLRYSLFELARDISTHPERDRLKLVFEFMARWAETPAKGRAAMIGEEPVQTGDKRWDALVAGLAEHVAFHADIDPPPWAFDESRFLDSFWYVVDSPLFRVWALHDTPAGLFRHHVMLSRYDLERV